MLDIIFFFHALLRSTCLHACFYAYMSRSMFSHAWVLGSMLCLLYAMFHVLVLSMPCLCAQTQAMFVMPCAIVALLSLYLSFLYFGLLVQTRSRPYGLHHRPQTLAYIKGFGSPNLHIYACLLLCFMIVLTFLVLGFAILAPSAGLTLGGYIRRP